MEKFDDWYHDECYVDACELVGPNSPEFDQTVERFENDPTRREAMWHRYCMESHNGKPS